MPKIGQTKVNIQASDGTGITSGAPLANKIADPLTNNLQSDVSGATVAVRTASATLVFNATSTNHEFQRTPTIFKRAYEQNTDNTVWTPAAGKKVRILGGSITVSGDATVTGGSLHFRLKDGSTIISAYQFTGAALAVAYGHVTVFTVDFGANGYLSTAANNVFNVTPTNTLATGMFSVNLHGTEE